jgi:pyruvate decarboxylase
MPSDMTTAQISGERLTAPLNVLPPANEQKFEAQIVDTVLNCLYSSKQPYILVDGLAAPDQIIDEVNEFARVTGLPTLSYTFGGGIMDGSLPNYHGVNAGNFGTLDFTPYTNTSDLALMFSPFLTNVNTQGGTLGSEKNITISFCRKKIEIGHETHTLHVKNFLRRLLDKLDTSRSPKPAKAALLPKIRDVQKALAPPDLATPIDQDTFYLRLSSLFQTSRHHCLRKHHAAPRWPRLRPPPKYYTDQLPNLAQHRPHAPRSPKRLARPARAQNWRPHHSLRRGRQLPGPRAGIKHNHQVQAKRYHLPNQ